MLAPLHPLAFRQGHADDPLPRLQHATGAGRGDCNPKNEFGVASAILPTDPREAEAKRGIRPRPVSQPERALPAGKSM